MLRLRGLCILLLLSAASLGQCIFPAAQSSNLLSYSFEPLVATNGMALRVILQFRGRPTGRTRLELPSAELNFEVGSGDAAKIRAIRKVPTLARPVSSHRQWLIMLAAVRS